MADRRDDVSPIEFDEILKVSKGHEPREYELDTAGLSDVKFGKELKEKEFLLRPDIVFSNHGSYGAVPRRVFELQNRYNLEREQYPDIWYLYNSKVYLDQARQSVAKYIGADLDEVLLVENVTTAINTVLKSYPFKPGEAIADCSLTYVPISHLCSDIKSRLLPDIERVKLPISFPISSEDDIVERYTEMFQQKPNIKFVILDHITSVTAIVMPVKKLIKVCHDNGALVLVDGAHAIGHLPLDMKDIDADIYTTNLHKWGFSPRGAAVLWFNPKHRGWINPPNTSWGMGQPLEEQFFYQGTNDLVPRICARHAIQFISEIGGREKIISYAEQLTNLAQELLLTEAGLKTLPIPRSMEAPCMRLAKLPHFVKFPRKMEYRRPLQRAIFGNTKVYGIIVLVEEDFYFRYSVQVYNDFDDVKAVVKVLKDFILNNAE